MPNFWGPFKNAINNKAFSTFFRDEITWNRLVQGLDFHGENQTLEYTPIQLKCLIGYNDFRTWPMDRVNESGSIDMQNMYVIFNTVYLRGLGFLNENDYFAFDAQRDYFTLKGIDYESSGDTDVAQAGDEPLLFYVILKRREYETGDKVHGWP